MKNENTILEMINQAKQIEENNLNNMEYTTSMSLMVSSNDLGKSKDKDLSRKINKLNRDIEEINALYSDNNFKLDEMELIHYALSENINITIEDLQGKTIYDSNTRRGMRMMGNMHHRGPRHMMQNNTGHYVEKSYPILYQGNKVARLIIGYDEGKITIYLLGPWPVFLP